MSRDVATGQAAVDGDRINYIMNCNSEANSLNDDHADKSADFQACKSHFHLWMLTFFSHTDHKRTSILRTSDDRSICSRIYRCLHYLYSPIQ